MVGFVIRGDEVMRRMRDGVVLSIPNVPTYPIQVTLGSRRNGWKNQQQLTSSSSSSSSEDVLYSN